MHLQFALVGADQARERLLIARPGQRQQPRNVGRRRADLTVTRPAKGGPARTASRISADVIGATGRSISQSMIEQTRLPSTNCCRTTNLLTSEPACAAIAR